MRYFQKLNKICGLKTDFTNRMIRSLLLFVVVAAILGSCKSMQLSGNRADKDTLAIVKTKFGEMTLVLYPETPLHRRNFLKMTAEKYYDSTTFHRIIKGFMIQGGDGNSKDDNPSNDGQGNPGYTVPAEFNPTFTHVQGALAAARMGDGVNPEKRSSGSQFYLVENKDGTHFLDQNYTVYGFTLKGIDVISKIAEQPKAPGDRPTSNIKMSVRLLPMNKKKVTETYGYDYTTHTIKPELIKAK